MESQYKTLMAKYWSSNLISSLTPALIIALSYVDPGKWAAFAECGSRFGGDLVFMVFLFNISAILCQYLSASIAVATGKDLAQICSEEYDKITCMILGIQAELSMFVLDLTMVLGTSHGLSAVFGIDLFACIFLTIIATFLFPLLAILENGKAKILCICLSSTILFSYFFGVLMGQSESSFSFNGIIIKLSGDSVFILMGLLGSTIMPHNFYLHSSIVQKDQGPLQKEAMCYNHLFSIITIFSGIFMVNCVLINLSTDLQFSTFQEVLSMLDQVYRSSLVPFILVLILFVSNQIMALTWNLVRRSFIHDLIGIEIPNWLHYLTIRLLSICPALICVYFGGPDGIYQLLLFSQVLIALLLPSSVIPLFRVASSRFIMGGFRISKYMECLASVILISMIVLKVIFVKEMVFGNSDWTSNLRSNVPIPFIVLLFVGSVSFVFMLWLVVTPLKSVKSRPLKSHTTPLVMEVLKSELTDHLDMDLQGQEISSKIENSLDINLPETLSDSESNHTVEENITRSEVLVSNMEDETSRGPEVEKELEPEEVKKESPNSSPSLLSEGPGSFRTGKNDDVGSGTGSLSRLAGLGRGARRQLTVILDDFWGQLFDFHGQPTVEARAKKFDVLLGLKIDSKIDKQLFKPDNKKDLAETVQSLYNSPKKCFTESPKKSFTDLSSSPYGAHQNWSNQAQLLNAYMRNSSVKNAYEASERRYSSMRIPIATETYDQTPATMHGHELASYISRFAKERNNNANYFNGQVVDLLPPKAIYGDSFTPLVQKARNALTTRAPPGFHNVSVNRNNYLQSQRLSQDFGFQKKVENLGEKRYYSLPGKGSQWDRDRDNLMGPTSTTLSGLGELSPSKVCRDAFSLQFSSSTGSGSLWSTQPFEQFGVAQRLSDIKIDKSVNNVEILSSEVDMEGKLIQSFRYCILRLLKLEGSDWLFKQNDGVDEDLIDRVAARERFHYEAETKQLNISSNNNELDYTKPSISLSPYCGEGCIYKVDLIVSFGVWCTHRILEFSLMESRPELWGKYTYVLNRLQGIVDLAFFKARPPLSPCFCLDIPLEWQQKSSMTSSNGNLPPPAKMAKGKFTTASIMLDLIKDVEIAISCRKGRSGTAAGDVAFPKGKENLASVLKRYKRRLSK